MIVAAFGAIMKCPSVKIAAKQHATNADFGTAINGSIGAVIFIFGTALGKVNAIAPTDLTSSITISTGRKPTKGRAFEPGPLQ